MLYAFSKPGTICSSPTGTRRRATGLPIPVWVSSAMALSLPDPLPRRLNLGCGQFPIVGFLNVDVLPNVRADLHLDLNAPEAFSQFPADHFDRIVMDHTLEHLDDVFGTIRALHRILRAGGMLEIRVPHFSRGITHPEHAHGFDVTFPEYMKPEFKGYIGVPLELISMRLDYMIRWDLKAPFISRWQGFVLKGLHLLVSWLANAHPYICSRFWCYWVGGFEQIEFIFRKPAPVSAR
jgi:hypothetical protein